MKVKCDFPPCDERATHEVAAHCGCGHARWDTKVCRTHLTECERVARRLLEPHHTVTVRELRPS